MVTKPKSTITFFLALPAAFVWASPVRGQESDEAPPSVAAAAPIRPVLRATRASDTIVIDGKLDDEAWREAPVAGSFTQREPKQGSPATETSEFHVLYDELGLYFGFKLYDRDTAGILRKRHGRDVASLQGRRDYWGEDDSVAILLDTFDDHRNAYYFSVNPNAAKTDGLITSEGLVKNFDWDGVWEAGASINDNGWSAEIFLPWTTLRFPEGDLLELGLNVQRVIRRKTEETFWAPVGLDESLWWMSKAGHLEGLEPPARSRPLEVKPFATSNWSGGEGFDGDELDFQPGVDVKFGVREGLTADLTVNTDFAQVEVDEQQVNLTRFPLFFPEKREFFLENAGLFDVGVERFVKLFFSRRIGLDAEGQPVPILFGGRLSGHLGRFELGALNVQTKSTASTPSSNHTAVRLRRQFLGRSTAGVLVTNVATGDGGTDNRVVAADLNLKPWRYLGFDGYLAKSSTPGLEGDDLSYGGILHWNTDDFGARLVFTDFQDNFQPAMGFLPRGGLHHYQPGARVGFRPRNGAVRRVVFRGITDLIYDADWILETRNSWIHSIVTFESGDEVQAQVTNRFELLDGPFEIHPTVAITEGDHTFTSYFLRLTSSNKRPLSGTLRYEWGDFFSGERKSWDLRGNLKMTSHFALEPRYLRNTVDLPGGSFITNLAGLQLRASPSNRWIINAFLQYNDSTERFSTNLRLDFIHRPGSDLFIVYNETRDIFGTGWQIEDRQLIVKFTYLFRR